MGSVYNELGDRQKAIEYHKKALQISTEIGNRGVVANENKLLGNVYDNLGEYRLAIEYNGKSLQINTEIGNRSGIAICYGNLGISVLIFAFDMDGFLNVWVFHDQVIHIKLDEYFKTILFLVMQFSEPLNVRVGRNSSFCNTGSATSTHDELDSPSMLPNRKPGQASKNAVHNAVGNLSNDVIDRNILEMLFQISVGSVKHLCKGNKLIIIPDRPLFFTPIFTPFSVLVDENGRYLSESYSIQIAPSLHTLKCTIDQSRGSKLGFALFVGNPAVENVLLNENRFAPLPNAAEEVKCLSKRFNATPLLAKKATKQEVLQHLSGVSIIHIAAHGEPTRGEIILAPNSSSCSPVPKPESFHLTQHFV